jgi:hypothetical protein
MMGNIISTGGNVGQNASKWEVNRMRIYATGLTGVDNNAWACIPVKNYSAHYH